MGELLLPLVAVVVALLVVEMVEMVVVQDKQDNLELEVVLDLLDQPYDNNGTMPSTGGSFANGTVGGQLESCTLGKYWAQQGVSPCSFMGFGYLINAIGNVVSGTTNTIIGKF